MKDANLRTTIYVYNLDGERTEIDRPDTTTKIFTAYDANGNVTSQTNGLNQSTSYGYDPLNRRISITDALGRTTSYGYDAAGNRTSLTDPAQQTTTYTYDVANQLKSVTYSDRITPNVTGITYDLLGQKIGLSDGTGPNSWTWDSLRRMTSYTNGNGVQVKWAYNLRGLVTTITYPGNLNVLRGYDNAGRWTSVQDWNGNQTMFGYDVNSNLISETLPAASGVVDNFTFDNANQLTGVSVAKGSTSLFSATYSRDPVNQLTGDTSAASATGSYRYTALNQLCYAGSSNSSACSAPPAGSTAYQYDAGDNLTQMGATKLTFNNANQLCWTASTAGSCTSPPSGATRYQYDNRGNRTSITPAVGQAQMLGYDQANRLTRYVTTSTTAYNYDADGLRMSKSAGATTQFLWDVAGNLPLLLKDSMSTYIYGPGDMPLELVNGSTTYYFHHDQLGSTRLLSDAAGVPQATYTYDPYGNLIANTGTLTNPMRFAGQYQDSESGLYYLRARYYDSATGQFLSFDPAAFATRQPYAYVANNPLNDSDPSGLMTLGHCLSASLTLGIFTIGGQACVVADMHGNVGYTTTATAQLTWANRPGLAGGTLTIPRQFSDGDSIDDLAGDFGSMSGSLTGPPIRGIPPCVAGEYFWGKGSRGQPVHGGQFGFGVGAPPGGTLNVGGSTTSVHKIGKLPPWAVRFLPLLG